MSIIFIWFKRIGQCFKNIFSITWRQNNSLCKIIFGVRNKTVRDSFSPVPMIAHHSFPTGCYILWIERDWGTINLYFSPRNHTSIPVFPAIWASTKWRDSDAPGTPQSSKQFQQVDLLQVRKSWKINCHSSFGLQLRILPLQWKAGRLLAGGF